MKALKKLIIFFLVFVIGFMVYGWYASKDIKEFCELAAGKSESSIKAESKEKEFIVIEGQDNSIVMLNHRAPYFRVGCKLELSEGLVEAANVFGAE